MLAYVAGGFAIIYAVTKASDTIERGLSQETRDDIALRLLTAEPSAWVRGWPQAFPEIFDRAFTQKHLSWSCFLRNTAASLLGIALLSTYYFAFHPGEEVGLWIVLGWVTGQPIGPGKSLHPVTPQL